MTKRRRSQAKEMEMLLRPTHPRPHSLPSIIITGGELKRKIAWHCDSSIHGQRRHWHERYCLLPSSFTIYLRHPPPPVSASESSPVIFLFFRYCHQHHHHPNVPSPPLPSLTRVPTHYRASLARKLKRKIAWHCVRRHEKNGRKWQPRMYRRMHVGPNLHELYKCGIKNQRGRKEKNEK